LKKKSTKLIWSTKFKSKLELHNDTKAGIKEAKCDTFLTIKCIFLKYPRLAIGQKKKKKKKNKKDEC
jgi:hypothetical protein